MYEGKKVCTARGHWPRAMSGDLFHLNKELEILDLKNMVKNYLTNYE